MAPASDVSAEPVLPATAGELSVDQVLAAASREASDFETEPEACSSEHVYADAVTVSLDSNALTDANGKLDDFSRLPGVSEEARQSLYKMGIRTFQDLQAADPLDLQHRLAAMGLIFSDTDIQKWSHEASMANRVEQCPGSVGSADDLTLIHGVGPAMQTLFHQRDIFRLEQIAALDSNELIEILGSKSTFEALDADSWPRQAAELLRMCGVDSPALVTAPSNG